MNKLKKTLTNLLLAFVLISIGFILGKHSVTPQESAQIKHNNHMVVYYFHSTFRCETCNKIESMTKSLLDSLYADELRSGAIVWQEVDFQQNEKLASSYKVAASCVVVAKQEEGEVSTYHRLDDVWEKMKNEDEFNSYISRTINEYLK